MAIRIPLTADDPTRRAFEDVEARLAGLEKAEQRVRELEREVTALRARLDAVSATPTYVQQGSTVIQGDLTVEGSVKISGSVDAPHLLDGAVVATPIGTGDSSLAQQVVEVHGSLAVLNALSAETIRCRNLIYTGTLTEP